MGIYSEHFERVGEMLADAEKSGANAIDLQAIKAEVQKGNAELRRMNDGNKVVAQIGLSLEEQLTTAEEMAHRDAGAEMVARTLESQIRPGFTRKAAIHAYKNAMGR